MNTKLKVLLLIFVLASFPKAQRDIAVGPYYGMAMPIVNDAAKSGMMFGIQGKVALIPMLSLGLHYSSRSYGNPSIIFHEGQPSELELEIDGGNVSAFGADLYLGKSGGLPGINFFMMGSFSTFKWTRDDYEDVSETAFLFGPGLEIVLPMKLGIEGRAMLEVASTGNDATYKAGLFFIGINYHLSLKPM